MPTRYDHRLFGTAATGYGQWFTFPVPEAEHRRMQRERAAMNKPRRCRARRPRRRTAK